MTKDKALSINVHKNNFKTQLTQADFIFKDVLLRNWFFKELLSKEFKELSAEKEARNKKFPTLIPEETFISELPTIKALKEIDENFKLLRQYIFANDVISKYESFAISIANAIIELINSLHEYIRQDVLNAVRAYEIDITHYIYILNKNANANAEALSKNYRILKNYFNSHLKNIQFSKHSMSSASKPNKVKNNLDYFIANPKEEKREWLIKALRDNTIIDESNNMIKPKHNHKEYAKGFIKGLQQKNVFIGEDIYPLLEAVYTYFKGDYKRSNHSTQSFNRGIEDAANYFLD